MPNYVTGGKNLKRFIHEAKRQQRRMEGGVVISVGFLDAVVAVVAAQLEFGDPSTNLPERPAFRIALQTIKRDLGAFVAERIDTRTMRVDNALSKKIATWLVEIVQRSYHDLERPGESERQIERKGFSDPLVGKEGPKLISRISAEIDGMSVE